MSLRRATAAALTVLLTIATYTVVDQPTPPAAATEAAAAPVVLATDHEKSVPGITFTPEQGAWLVEMHRQHLERAAFFAYVAAIQAAIPRELIPARWCEAGNYIGLPYGQTNYAAYTHGWDGASGGYQMLKSTWERARRHVPGAERWAIAAHAPPFVQDAAATALFHTEGGMRPWAASRSCWSRYL